VNLRTDAFNVINHPNLGQPNATFTPGGSAGTFGQISSTRFPIGDFGSSRQLRVSAKLVFWAGWHRLFHREGAGADCVGGEIQKRL